MFCSVCGLEMNYVDRNRYNVYTGNRLISYECPSNKCDHDGIRHIWMDRSFYLFSINLRPRMKCIKCGKVDDCL